MKQRIITGLIGGAAFLFLMYAGGAWYSLLVFLLAVIGYFEFMRMAGIQSFYLAGLLGYVLMLSILWPSLLFSDWLSISMPDLMLPVILLLLIYSVLRKNQFHIEHVALTLVGALYIGYGFTYMAATRNLPEGFMLTVMVIMGIWSTDSGAYFVGKAIGKRKLWPEISPNKTVEGALGGLVASVLIVLSINASFGHFAIDQALTIALVAGIVGQLGDLVESAFKRHFHVKDSGQLIPGHGGVLDRFDSFLLVFPVLHLLGIV
ncbi:MULTISPECIES: phosphatidate cytidylyltransferase [Brevibacillus]|uniref:phosphatidate cytidylyltransferase n=1 Tax=Brevibacillus TaxID=55080 RepID=UPI000D0EB008|nr:MULTISPECIES: phosphatidate cytidylyltransferase [Brevibacillus]PSJ70302.1 phosphatidate cytidylyltransferase [Brevibacillus brevis]RED30189.1 phosphatidate cytidylyltransferase [Brevibacillus brevis]TQK75067.1 phosphatidate cytidylyltransferase [Brevibacillus sp. AG162]VEF88736.1 Phosphatidate cytidylyltransferase [Brevibacillus brevis]GEC88074.1 phosphatidate cytidylyltransferase [Brevibacillus brevis]